jgi:methionyl aminopeptidase
MALENACNSIKVGMKVCEIGKIIDTTIKSYGLHPVRNLAGHGLGIYKVHMPPTIPNYDDRSTAIIKPGMTFAIEPFATDGEGYIYEVDPARIYAFTANKNAKSVEAKNLLIKIKALKGLPFSLHEILDENFTLELTIKGIDELMKIGAIDGYGPLIEETGGMVAQFEHSVLVDDEGNVIITTR